MDTSRLTLVESELNDELVVSLDANGRSGWATKSDFYTAVKFDDKFIFTTMHRIIPDYNVVGENWARISVISNFLPLKNDYTEQEINEIRDIAIYHSMSYLFVVENVDGLFGLVKLNSPTEPLMQHINNGYKVRAPNARVNINNIPIYHWQYTRAEWLEGKFPKPVSYFGDR